MEIKNLFKKLKKQPRETLFLALEIYQGLVKSVVWQINEGRVKVKAHGSIERFEESDQASLINAVDKSFTQAVEEINQAPQAVIFGLCEDWLDGTQIKENKKPLLKLVCQKFELKPLGFVQSQEALLEYFNSQGAPLNAVMVRPSESEAYIWLVQQGQIKGIQTVVRSEDLGADVAEGLARFKSAGSLPPRIFLYDADLINEEIKQQLDSYSWQESLPFLHLPKVETLRPTITVEAVAVSGGSEAAQALGVEIESAKNQKGKIGESMVSSPTEEVKQPEKTKEESGASDLENVKAVEFGFISGKDAAQSTEHSKKKEPLTAVSPVKASSSESEIKINDPKKTTWISKVKNIFQKTLRTMTFPFRFIKNLFSSASGVNKRNSKTKLLLGGTLGLLTLIFGSLFAAWWYLPKAEVIVYMSPKILEEEMRITFSPQAESADLENNVIPAQLIEVEIEDSLSQETTGEGLVGDPASGEVTIYNKTELEKTFEPGTTLVGPDNLKFLTEDEVTVASQSATETESGVNIEYGQAKVKIKAASIGPEGNLPGGTELSLSSYSDSVYSAKTENGLSGGTSREVKVVAAEDQENLEDDLKKELNNTALEQIANQNPDQLFLNQEVASEVISKDFSDDVGTETDELSLSLKMKFSNLAYSAKEFESFLLYSLAGVVPDGFELHQRNLSTQLNEVQVDDDFEAQAQAIIKAKLLPVVDQTQIKSRLKGKYPAIVQDYLKTLPNFESADIIIRPTLPARLNTLPHQQKNIDLKIRVKI